MNYIVTGITLGFFTTLTGLMIWLFRIAIKHQDEKLQYSVKTQITKLDDIRSDMKSFGDALKLLEIFNKAQNEALKKEFNNGFTKEFDKTFDKLMTQDIKINI